MFNPASRQMSTRRVASETSVRAPGFEKLSPPPPKVPVPKLKTGTFRPEPPSCLYSMVIDGFGGGRGGWFLLDCRAGRSRLPREGASESKQKEAADANGKDFRPVTAGGSACPTIQKEPRRVGCVDADATPRPATVPIPATPAIPVTSNRSGRTPQSFKRASALSLLEMIGLPFLREIYRQGNPAHGPQASRYVFQAREGWSPPSPRSGWFATGGAGAAGSAEGRFRTGEVVATTKPAAMQPLRCDDSAKPCASAARAVLRRFLVRGDLGGTRDNRGGILRLHGKRPTFTIYRHRVVERQPIPLTPAADAVVAVMPGRISSSPWPSTGRGVGRPRRFCWPDGRLSRHSSRSREIGVPTDVRSRCRRRGVDRAAVVDESLEPSCRPENWREKLVLFLKTRGPGDGAWVLAEWRESISRWISFFLLLTAALLPGELGVLEQGALFLAIADRADRRGG